MEDFTMQKNIKHREVDLTSKNTDQQTNRILKKIFQNLSKINLKRTLSTAAIIALLTVKIGGGGGGRNRW
jgi:hypothetical protein